MRRVAAWHLQPRQVGDRPAFEKKNAKGNCMHRTAPSVQAALAGLLTLATAGSVAAPEVALNTPKDSFTPSHALELSPSASIHAPA